VHRHADLQLLAAAVELTARRIHVDVADAWARARGQAPTPSDWVEIRRAVLRLERDGLVRSDLDLHIEPTAAGRRVVEPTSSA
jgi:hypothetical protein